MASIGPVGERERIAELDILRGVALFGVLTMNFVGFAGATATKAQLAALPTAAIDEWVYFATIWLIGDKANTMFATLFGLGFYLQMKRGEGRPGFEKRYSRRLFWLLIFGWLNALFLWIWDILNLYALAGFALLAMRRWRTRTLVIFGAIAALYSDKLQEWWTGALGWTLIPESFFSDAAILDRQAVMVSGDYPSVVVMMWSWTWTDWLAGGLLVAWIVYALGRFALGAAIGRSGILDDVPAFLPLLKRIALIAIPAGLALALVVSLISRKYWQPLGDNQTLVDLAQSLRSPTALVLAAGYSAGIVVALHKGWGKKLFHPFGDVGRMALTNYLIQGFLYAFVLFGVGPGLGLAGKVGSTAIIGICITFFAFQIAFSHWWLMRYRFGPMEWVWRTLTYGRAPAMSRDMPEPLAAS